MVKTKIIIGAKLILIIGLVTIFLISLNSCGGSVSEVRDVSGFDEVAFYGNGRLFIEQGDTESITVEASKNLLPFIKTEVSDGTLSISIPDEGGEKPPAAIGVKYYLKVKDLNKISTFGDGSIDFPDFITDSVIIISSGSGNIEITGKAKSQEVTINGSAKYSAKDFETNDTIVKINGSGNAHVNAIDNLEITIFGSGNVKYEGNPSVQQSKN
jgi:hypothetical protein